MKNLKELFEWYKNKGSESEWRDNILRLVDAVENNHYVDYFTNSNHKISIENMILEYSIKDYEMVIKCLCSIHRIKYNNAKLLLIKKLSETIVKITELGDD